MAVDEKVKQTLANAKRLARSLVRRSEELNADDVKKAREYVADYWEHLLRFHPKDQDNLIGLPKPYLVPSYAEGHEFDYEELYYWDSYFMVQGMLKDPTRKELVLGILEDLCTMFERYKIIPNGSRLYYLSRSHPPFLTSLIFDAYAAYDLDKKWLAQYIAVAKQEYEIVWMGTRKPNARQAYQGLSRYYDFNYLHDLAEAESGWDMTPRFGRKAMNYLAVDLNSLLYKYETDFAKAARILGDKKEAAVWDVAAEHRKKAVDKLMWSNLHGLFYDYNFVKEKRGNVASLAGFYPLWAGLADEKQAKQLVKTLRKFEAKGGLTTTDTQPLNQLVPGKLPTQWAYPNGWAPLHFLVVKGLQRYGYFDDAERIMRKWVKTNLDWYTKNGIFLEKYNVVQPSKPPVKGVYPSQTGFGWTNAVFERFCQELFDARG